MKKKLILLLAVAALAAVKLLAQQNMTLYQMHEIVQSNALNPAIPGDCKWTVGFPALGNISLAASLPVSYNDLGAGQDLFKSGELLSKLKNTNTFSANIHVNLLMIGYRTDKTYLQFTVNERASIAGLIDKEPIELMLKGNAQFIGQTVDARPSFAGVYYREYGLGASRYFGSGLWIGARVKLLFGRLGASIANNSVSLYTDPDTYDLTLASDILIRASFPRRITAYNPYSSIKSSEADLTASYFIFNPSNVGGALDVGVRKTTESGWKLSASILNIGMISWSKNAHALNQKKPTVTYTGPTPSISRWQDMIDTIKSVVTLERADESYTQSLSPVLMFGASYPVHEYIRLGLTGMGEYRTFDMPWALTATAFTEGLEHFTAGLSYTVNRNSYLNVGLGVGVRFGAFNMHLLTDNIAAVFSPFSQRYATFQFGVSFRFGCDGVSSSSRKDATPCAAYKGALGVSGRKMESVPCPTFGGKR